MLLSGVNMVVLVTIATMMNAGELDGLLTTPEAAAYFGPIKGAILNLTPLTTVLGGVERMSALAIQMGLSIIVLYSLTSGRKIVLLYAILIHAIIDFPAGLYQTGVLTNLYILEAIIALFAAVSIVWIVKSRKLFAEIGGIKDGTTKITK